MRRPHALGAALPFAAALATAVAASCSGGSALTNVVPKQSATTETDNGQASPDPAPAPAPAPSTEEGEPAGQPQSVSGAFLACGFMDSANDVEDEAVSGDDPEIGCGFYQKQKTNAYTQLAVPTTQMQPSVVCDDGQAYQVTMRPLSSGGPLAFTLAVSPDEMPCTISIQVYGTSVTRPIPTITTFDAQAGFDAGQDATAMATVTPATNQIFNTVMDTVESALNGGTTTYDYHHHGYGGD